jgi:hypothetical protein
LGNYLLIIDITGVHNLRQKTVVFLNGQKIRGGVKISPSCLGNGLIANVDIVVLVTSLPFTDTPPGIQAQIFKPNIFRRKVIGGRMASF